MFNEVTKVDQTLSRTKLNFDANTSVKTSEHEQKFASLHMHVNAAI